MQCCGKVTLWTGAGPAERTVKGLIFPKINWLRNPMFLILSLLLTGSAVTALFHGPPHLRTTCSVGDTRPSAGTQARLYNRSSYQSSSAHQGLVHASHHLQSIVPSSLLCHCSCQLPLRRARAHHSSTDPCLEESRPLYITPSANVSHTALLPSSFPSAFPASLLSACLPPASLIAEHSLRAAEGQWS